MGYRLATARRDSGDIASRGAGATPTSDPNHLICLLANLPAIAFQPIGRRGGKGKQRAILKSR